MVPGPLWGSGGSRAFLVLGVPGPSVAIGISGSVIPGPFLLLNEGDYQLEHVSLLVVAEKQ